MRKGILDWLEVQKADVVCLQEVKAYPEQVDLTLFESLGYENVWFSAQKAGYSGVCVFSKHPFSFVEKGINNDIFDAEGRLLRIDFKNFVLINTYMPSGTSGNLRQDFKYEWLDCFYDYMRDLKKEKKNIIICGDFNIAHEPIDIHNPISNKNSSGFLPQERDWFSKFLACGYFDIFRKLYPTKNDYSWWSYRHGAKEKNMGWRIDYFLIDTDFFPSVTSMEYLKEVNFSDHCPVVLHLDGSYL